MTQQSNGKATHPMLSENERGCLVSEIEELKRKIIDKNFTIVQMEAKMAQEMPLEYTQGQLASLRASCDGWQDKYDRLLGAHKRLQRVNQGLEDKLLRLVDRSQSEKAQMYQDTLKLTKALNVAAQAINRLQTENECYRKDMNIATQLLQCNPNQYASCKLDTLPPEMHEKARILLGAHEAPPAPPRPAKVEPKVIRVPIPTFPPSAVVYSVDKFTDESPEDECKSEEDVVSAAILAAVLKEREKERKQKHCRTCTCPFNASEDSQNESDSGANATMDLFRAKRGGGEAASLIDLSGGFDVKAIDVGTQTLPSYIGESGKVTSTCIYCQSVKTLNEAALTFEKTSIKGDKHPTTPSNGPAKKHTPGPAKIGFFPKDDKRGSMNCPWDWHPESQDSGSPSTPTSLISASLSYESGPSSFASPQESPGHVSLHSVDTEHRPISNPPPSKTLCHTDVMTDSYIPVFNTHNDSFSKGSGTDERLFINHSNAQSNLTYVYTSTTPHLNEIPPVVKSSALSDSPTEIGSSKLSEHTPPIQGCYSEPVLNSGSLATIYTRPPAETSV